VITVGRVIGIAPADDNQVHFTLVPAGPRWCPPDITGRPGMLIQLGDVLLIRTELDGEEDDHCPSCDVGATAPDARCVRCSGPACSYCDRCHGCGRVVCERCDLRPGRPFSFPGDREPHPHREPEGRA
jgi:hypothetical protein